MKQTTLHLQDKIILLLKGERITRELLSLKLASLNNENNLPHGIHQGEPYEHK